MSKIIEFPKKNMNIEVQVVDQDKIEECASAVMIYLNGLHVSKFANWEEITNSLILAFASSAHKAGISPQDAMEMLVSVQIQNFEDVDG
tara:strand:- start:511 stop:777 length:267 start_codon:yes stop_codon:yes gene_type:complete